MPRKSSPTPVTARTIGTKLTKTPGRLLDYASMTPAKLPQPANTALPIKPRKGLR